MRTATCLTDRGKREIELLLLHMCVCVCEFQKGTESMREVYPELCLSCLLTWGERGLQPVIQHNR